MPKPKDSKSIKLKKGMVIQGKTIADLISYQVWYNKKTKQIQGQAPYFMVVADLDRELPDIIQKPLEIEKREVAVVVFEAD